MALAPNGIDTNTLLAMDTCSAILAFGIRNEFRLHSSLTLEETINDYLYDVGSFSKSNEFDAKAYAVFKGIPLGFEGRNSNDLSEFHQSLKDFSKTSKMEDKKHVFSNFIDKGIVQAWLNCRQNTDPNKLKVLIDYPDDDTVRLTMAIPFRPNETKFRLAGITIFPQDAATEVPSADQEHQIGSLTNAELEWAIPYEQIYKRSSSGKRFTISLSFSGRDALNLAVPEAKRPLSYNSTVAQPIADGWTSPIYTPITQNEGGTVKEIKFDVAPPSTFLDRYSKWRLMMCQKEPLQCARFQVVWADSIHLATRVVINAEWTAASLVDLRGGTLNLAGAPDSSEIVQRDDIITYDVDFQKRADGKPQQSSLNFAIKGTGSPGDGLNARGVRFIDRSFHVGYSWTALPA